MGNTNCVNFKMEFVREQKELLPHTEFLKWTFAWFGFEVRAEFRSLAAFVLIIGDGKWSFCPSDANRSSIWNS